MYEIRPNSFVYTVTITEESEYLTDPMTIPRVFICINPFILTTKILKIPVGHITAQNIITKMYSDKQTLEKKKQYFCTIFTPNYLPIQKSAVYLHPQLRATMPQQNKDILAHSSIG